MADLLPIRPDVEVTSDSERILIEYVVEKVMAHRQAYGEAAQSVALVTEGPKGRTVGSFSTRRDQDRLASCSAAAALLLQRATEN